MLTLSDSMIEKRRAIVDDHKNSTKELLEELHLLYTTSNHQAITNLINRLNSLVFVEKKENWDKLLSTFIIIIYELGSYDQEISAEENNSKLLRTLP